MIHKIFIFILIVNNMKYNNIEIKRINHDCFKINGSKIIYIDPFKLEKNDRADFILITHNHFDHMSIEDIKKIITPSTVIIASVSCTDLNSLPNKKVFMKPNEKFNDSIKVESVHAYNINKKFHPRENNGLGFIVTIDNTRIYHAGDTDIIPEMKNIKNIDLALLPVSGTYVMDVKEAVESANLINPKIVIPMHYGSIVGSASDGNDFKKLYKGNSEVI